MTFIDPAPGWFEIAEIDTKDSASISQKLDQVWLSRYPRPRTIVFDNGSEFKKDFRYIFWDYGIRPKLMTVKNPQENGILERIHAVLATMLRTQNLKKLNFDVEDGLLF